jgi:hypothetical protein
MRRFADRWRRGWDDIVPSESEGSGGEARRRGLSPRTCSGKGCLHWLSRTEGARSASLQMCLKTDLARNFGMVACRWCIRCLSCPQDCFVLRSSSLDLSRPPSPLRATDGPLFVPHAPFAMNVRQATASCAIVRCSRSLRLLIRSLTCLISPMRICTICPRTITVAVRASETDQVKPAVLTLHRLCVV